MNLMLHPMLVHFPIALWALALTYEIGHLILKNEDLHKTAVLIAWAAVFFTPLAVATGLWEQVKHHLNHPVLNQHKQYAFMVLGVSLVCLPVLIGLHLRPSKFLRKILFVCLLLATIGVGLAGFYGGKLVFEYSVGVEP